MTPAASHGPEPCHRTGATDAGLRHAAAHPGEVLVLQHTGAEVGRWQLVAHHYEHGRAVEEFKARLPQVVRGALAVWHHGRVSRFERGDFGD